MHNRKKDPVPPDRVFCGYRVLLLRIHMAQQVYFFPNLWYDNRKAVKA